MASASATFDREQQEGRRIPLAWLIGLLAAAAVVSLATLGTTSAAFSSSTSNQASKFKAGTVNLTANDTATVPLRPAGDGAEPAGVEVHRRDLLRRHRQRAPVRHRDERPGRGGQPGAVPQHEDRGSTGAAGGSTFDCTGFSQPTPAPAPILDATLQTFTANTNFGNGLTVFGGPTGSSIPQLQDHGLRPGHEPRPGQGRQRDSSPGKRRTSDPRTFDPSLT